MGFFGNKISEISKLELIAHKLAENSQYEELVKCGKSIIDLDPADAYGWSVIGDGYLNMEKFEESIPYFEKALEINPNDFLNWHQLAIAFEGYGKIKQAISALHKVIETNPENQHNRSEIALESISYLEKSLSNNSGIPEIENEMEQKILDDILVLGDKGVECAFRHEMIPTEMVLERLDLFRIKGEKINMSFVTEMAIRQIERIRRAMRD